MCFPAKQHDSVCVRKIIVAATKVREGRGEGKERVVGKDGEQKGPTVRS